MSQKCTLIKADEAADVEALGLRTFSFSDVTTEACRILAVAQAQADEIICKAEQQAESIRPSAHQTGYRDGYQEGFAKGRIEGHDRALAEAAKKFDEQQAGLVETCKRLIAGIEADRQAWYVSARQDLIDLAMAICRRVVVHVGQHERNVILANLERAVELAGPRSQVTVMINPADAESAKLFAQSLLDAQQQWKHVRVMAEPEISPGGCRIQWESGAIDATLETQLDRIAEELNIATDVTNNGSGYLESVLKPKNYTGETPVPHGFQDRLLVAACRK